VCGIDAFKFYGPETGDYFSVYFICFVLCIYQKQKKVTSIEDSFVTIYNQIRADPFFRNVTILVFVESNYGNDANWLYGLTKRVRNMTNIKFVSDDESVKIGVNTSELSKLRGYDIMKTYVAMGAVRFYKNMITVNNDYERAFPGPDPRLAMRNLLIQQIEQLKQYGKKKPKGPHLIVITGIHSEDNTRLPNVDDVVMAFIIFLYNATRWYKQDFPNVDYAAIHRMRYKVLHVEEEFGYISKTVNKRLSEHEQQQALVNRAGLFN